MKKIIPLVSSGLMILFFVMLSFNLQAQVPTTQDCLGAIAVCDYIYVEEYTASGEGNYPNEIPSGQSCPNHCMDGEKNTRWYTWTVIESGDLSLTITPATASDDYDWAVFDLTDMDCEDIYSSPQQMLSSCNAAGGAGFHGATGINTPNGGTLNCNGAGNTNKWNINLPVYEGESYTLVVSDWTQSPGGYTLDFSASSAVILDDRDPYIAYIASDEITACGTNELAIVFNENVKCSSVQYGDFLLSGPGGPYVIDSVFGQTCSIGGNNEKDYILYFTPPIYQPGDFELEIRQFSFISDACNNYADPEIYPFIIDLDAPTASAGDDIDIAYAATATLDGSAYGGSGNYAYHWEPVDLLVDPNIQNPTTVSLTVSTEFILEVDDNVSACKSEDTMSVNVVGGPLSLSASVDNPIICLGEIVNLSSFPDGGGGNYTYSWSSVPEGFTSTQQNPSDYPNQDITYTVEVTDGYTTLEASVSVIVNPNPFAEAGEDIEINLGETTSLNGEASGGSGSYIYQWEPASWLEQNNIANPTTLLLPETTTFTLLVTDNTTGCAGETDNMHVIVSSEDLMASPFAEPAQVCFGQSTIISTLASGGGGGNEYEWTAEPGGFVTNESVFEVSPEVTTIYTLHLSDQFGNEFTGSIEVVVNPLPIVDLVKNYPIYGTDSIKVCVRDSVLLDAGFNDDPEGTEYFWKSENYVNRYLKVLTNGSWIDFQTHKVLVTHGITQCVDSGQITIIFDFNECEISVPETEVGLEEAISILPNPNNGNFTMSFSKNVSNLSLKVYDIRGSVMYETLLEGNYGANQNRKISTGINDKGVYLVVLQTGGEWYLQKMVIN